MIEIKVEEANGGREVSQICKGLGSDIVKDLEHAVASVLMVILPNIRDDMDDCIEVLIDFAADVCHLVASSHSTLETKSMTTVHTPRGFDALLTKLHATLPPKDIGEEAKEQLVDYISKATNTSAATVNQKVKDLEAAFDKPSTQLDKLNELLGGTNNE